MIRDSVDRRAYFNHKEKYGWIEEEPYHFNSNSITGGWYKSWGDGVFIPYHREDGPARMWQGGFIEYWYNGIHFKCVNSLEEFYIKRLLE